MIAFTEILRERADTSPGGAPVFVVPESWRQGRSTFGGLTAAIALRGVLVRHAALPPLRSAQITFVGPAAGRLRVESHVLRRGRAVTFVEASVVGEEALSARALFVFGSARPSSLDDRFVHPPEVPPPEACPSGLEAGEGPVFAQHFERRLAAGELPFSGGAGHAHATWIRHVDPEADDVVALLAVADMPPPGISPRLRERVPLSSMSWLVNLASAAPRSEDGWWLVRCAADDAADGYTSQDMAVWNRAGELSLTSRQLLAIFA